MRASFLGRGVLLVCLVLAVLAGCHRQASTHILFIGNSYTFVNGGIDKQLEGLSPTTDTQSVAIGGYTLQDHWTNGQALQTIHQGGFDYVILQEQSQTPVLDRNKFYDFAREFDQEIQKSGARTVLLMTWERPDSRNYGVTTANLAAAYNTLGVELRAKVAPAGLTFDRSLRSKPDLVLYSQDGHPTIEGTYLAACVLYGTIFGTSPVGNPYSDRSISADTSTFLQQMAAQSLGY